MSAFEEAISFWGGIASIVALCITAVTGFVVLYRKGKAQRERELDELADLHKTMADRTKQATTQGKRQDLFAYHQSLFTRQRFNHVIWEIQISAYHIGSLMIFIVLYSLDANADYLADRAFGRFQAFRDHFGVSIFLFGLLLLVPNLLLRRRVNSSRRRLNVASLGLTDELAKFIDQAQSG